MCGRFTLRASWEELAAFLGLSGPARNLRPRYNVAPGQLVAAVRLEGTERRLSMLRWGFVPAGAKDPAIGHRLINARAETAHAKPLFRRAFASRRCLVPADGFYEWQREGARKRPWFIGTMGGGPFAFAGLWERWRVREGARLPPALADFAPGDAIETCTILTTAAHEAVARVHPRMPVILPPALFGPWLAGEAVALGPCLPETMTVRPVGTLVNKPSNDDPRCVEPVSLS